MITYVPSIYPDELLYSVFARMQAHSGYLTYSHALDEIYVSKHVRPDPEFINKLKPEVCQILERVMPMEEIIKRHTMFPYYGRFCNKEKRQRAFKSLLDMDGNHKQILPIPIMKKETERFLRFCPICAKLDRDTYGEAYFHRSHQMVGVNICPFHKCELRSSTVAIVDNRLSRLEVAEFVIPNNAPILISNSPIECQLAEYIYQLFQQNVDFDSEVTIGQFLKSKIEGTKYLSVRGERRYVSLLYKDLCKYYQELPQHTVPEVWLLQKIFNDQKINVVSICQLCMFLGVPVDELTCLKLPPKTQTELFEEKAVEMRKGGMRFNQIAQELGVCTSTIQLIGKHQPRKAKVYTVKTHEKRNWEQMDHSLLPEVKRIVEEFYKREGRPSKLTKVFVSEALNYPNMKWRRFPLCLAEYHKHEETMEQFWAREVDWAINVILHEGERLNYTQIFKRVHIKRENLRLCLPCLEKRLDENMMERIRTIIE